MRILWRNEFNFDCSAHHVIFNEAIKDFDFNQISEMVRKVL